MRLKARLDKLEPNYAAAWEKAWERALRTKEVERLESKIQAAMEKVRDMSEEEAIQFNDAFVEDQTSFPVIEAWDGEVFITWIETVNTFLATRDFNWEHPDFSLWPDQVPEPPDVAQEVVNALSQRANSYGPFAGEYAFYYEWVLIAQGIREAKAVCQTPV